MISKISVRQLIQLCIFLCVLGYSNSLSKLARELITGEYIGFEFVIVTDDLSANVHNLSRLEAELVTASWEDWRKYAELIIPFTRPTLVFLIPNNFAHFLEIVEQVGILLNQDQNPWLTWTPIFFILCPCQGQEAGNTLELLTQHFETRPNLEFPLDSDIFIIDDRLSNSNYEVYEIFSQNNRSNIRRILLDSLFHYTTFSNYLPKSVRRENFHGARINCVGLGDLSYQLQLKLEIVNGTVRFLSGLAFQILMELEYSLNFSHFAVLGEGWIEQLENGTWTGMAKQLQKGEADIGISQSMNLAYRFKGLDFLHPTSFGNIKAFFRQPSASSIRDIFISPFNFDLWICLLLIWVLLISSLMSIYCIRRKYTFVERQDTQVVNEAFLWTVGSLCQKGWHVWPSNMSMKIVFICGSLVGLIYYVAFSASLVSTLSIKVIPIKSIMDLAQSHLEILGDFWLPNTPAIVEEIEASRRNYKKPPAADQYIEIDDAIPKLLSQPAAYITFNDGFLTVFHRYNYTDQLYCDTFSAIPVSQAPLCSGMVVRKGSPYREFFNHKILMMRERGTSFRNNAQYLRGTSASCFRQTNFGEGLEFHDVVTAFFILFGGFGLSLIAAIVERTLVTMGNGIREFFNIRFKKFK